jgi:hypothetical protein
VNEWRRKRYRKMCISESHTWKIWKLKAQEDDDYDDESREVICNFGF